MSLNPSPAIHRCTACLKTIGKIQAIQCNLCDLWTPRKCASLRVKQLRELGNRDDFFLLHGV